MCKNREASKICMCECVCVYLVRSLIVSAWFPLFIVLRVALIVPSLSARALITAPIPHSLWQITSSTIKTIVVRRLALINIPIMLCNYASLICGCGLNLWKQSFLPVFYLKWYKCWDFFFLNEEVCFEEKRLQTSLLQWTTETLLLPYNSWVILSFFTALQYF